MDCPVCCKPMREFEYSQIVIEVCPTCRGVWLDHGELEKIIKYETGRTPQNGPSTAPLPAPRSFLEDFARFVELLLPPIF